MTSRRKLEGLPLAVGGGLAQIVAVMLLPTSQQDAITSRFRALKPGRAIS